METGIKINNIEIQTGDVVFFDNITNDALINTFSEKLEKNIITSVACYFFKYEKINLWSVIMIPFNKDIPVSNGVYHEWSLEKSFIKEDFPSFDKLKIDVFKEPPISFLYSLCSKSKHITINDSEYKKYFEKSFLEDNKKSIQEYDSWDF